MALSPDVDTILFPSGLNIAEYTVLLCPSKVFIQYPVSVSHIRTDSSDAVTIFVPSGLKTADQTLLGSSSKVLMHWPFSASQRWTIRVGISSPM